MTKTRTVQGKSKDYKVGYGKPPEESRFKKGVSGNPHGRPKNFDELRMLVKSIAAEKLQGADLTRVEAMILSMSTSRNPRDKELFLQYGFGKVKEQVEQSGETTIRIIRDDGNTNQTPAPASGATDNQERSEAV